MKLYDCPKHTWVTVCPTEGLHGPPEGLNPEVGDSYYFSHLDGMYSYCKDSKGHVVHLPAWTEVELVK